MAIEANAVAKAVRKEFVVGAKAASDDDSAGCVVYGAGGLSSLGGFERGRRIELGEEAGEVPTLGRELLERGVTDLQAELLLLLGLRVLAE